MSLSMSVAFWFQAGVALIGRLNLAYQPRMPREATVVRQLVALQQRNLVSEARENLSEVQQHLRLHPEDTIEVRRMIRRGQLAAMHGSLPNPDDKPVNNNLNCIKNMSVKLMRRCVLECSGGVITATSLQLMLSKNREHLKRLYRL
eukprot:6720019-Lingulodinium_polyedra.AAC.1